MSNRRQLTNSNMVALTTKAKSSTGTTWWLTKYRTWKLWLSNTLPGGGKKAGRKTSAKRTTSSSSLQKSRELTWQKKTRKQQQRMLTKLEKAKTWMGDKYVLAVPVRSKRAKIVLIK